MSRLQSLNIPFAQGHSDEVDEKLLPNGVFADVSNGRLPQLGSLRLRRGWRPLVMKELANNATLNVVDLYSYGDSLVALCLRSSNVALALATYTQSNATRPWVLNTDSGLPPVTNVRTVGNFPGLVGRVIRASAALTSDGVYGCVLQQSSTESVFRVFVRDTDETVAYGSLANGSRVRKVISLGATFGLVENATTSMVLWTLNPTATAPAFASTATLDTTASSFSWFDVATATETTPTAIHLVHVIVGTPTYLQFTTAGVLVGLTKLIDAAADTEAVAVCSNDTDVNVVFQRTPSHAIELLTFPALSPHTTSAGPTVVNTTQQVIQGLFCVAMSANNSSIYVASEHSSGATDLLQVSNNLLNSAHSTNVRTQHLGQQLCAGYLARNFVAAPGFVRRSEPVGFSTPITHPGSVAFYSSNVQPWFYAEFGAGALETTYVARPPFWPAQCPTGDCLALLPYDDTPGSDTTPIRALCRSLRLRTTERRPAAQLAGALYITGGVLTRWVGAAADDGMLMPIFTAIAGSNSTGTLANGVYQYRAVMTWTDEKQDRHRSLVSAPAELNLTGANDTITISVVVPKTLRRNSNLITNPVVELYRTEAGPGELFYLVGSGTVDTFADTVTIIDTTPDASILTQSQLYTQGEFGATSGILEMAPARPSAFVAGTKRRLVVGSADTLYQFSQASFPETAAWFAEPGFSGDAAQAYFDDVEAGRIAGVAALDELVFVGTRERIYVTGGTGPNLAGVGEFDAPHRLPTDVGFFDNDSILETSEGLWFQGSADGMYHLARGASTPEPDHAVQDRLSAGVVGCGYDAGDNVAAWATGAATALVRHLDFKLWVGDTLPFTPIVLIGHRGRLYAVASDGVVWAQEATAFGDGTAGATAVVLRVTTGSAEPFEMAGQGRLAAVELLGEFQAAAAVLGEISYDDGLTWTSLGTHAVTGLSVGETFQKQWYPARQRGDRFRFRVTMTATVTTTEGCRLAGLTVYYTKARGPSRLASASRK